MEGTGRNMKRSFGREKVNVGVFVRSFSWRNCLDDWEGKEKITEKTPGGVVVNNHRCRKWRNDGCGKETRRGKKKSCMSGTFPRKRERIFKQAKSRSVKS